MLAVRNSVDESERHMRLSQNIKRSSLSRSSSAARSPPRPGSRSSSPTNASYKPTSGSFDSVDRNRDGVISREELRQYNYSKQLEYQELRRVSPGSQRPHKVAASDPVEAFKERVKSLGAMIGNEKREGEVWEAREVSHPGETPAQAGLMMAVRQEEEAEKAAREATLTLKEASREAVVLRRKAEAQAQEVWDEAKSETLRLREATNRELEEARRRQATATPTPHSLSPQLQLGLGLGHPPRTLCHAPGLVPSVGV